MPSTPEIQARIRAHNRLCQMQNVMDQAVQGWNFQYHHPADFQQAPAVTDSQARRLIAHTFAWFIGLLAVFMLVVLVAAVSKSAGV